MKNKTYFQLVGTILFLLFSSAAISAQTAEFTYQGNLNDGTTAANASYDFEFLLYDVATGGAQIGTTLSRSSVAVTDGIFAVKLDFGAGFPGGDRYLEIRVKNAGSGGGFTTLAPRQKVTSAPYALQSLNATNAANAANATNATTAVNSLNLGGIAANQFVQTNDSRLTDARNPLAGSPNYIQNSTPTQSSTSFNISGNGTVGGTLSGNVVNSTTQFNFGGSRILGANAASNLYLGKNTGTSVGIGNSFLGNGTGALTTTGTNNVFVGENSGSKNQTGSNNMFAGFNSGDSNTTQGSNITLIGANTLTNGNSSLQFATAIGAGATVSTSNTIQLGRSNGNESVRIPGSLTVVNNATFSGFATFQNPVSLTTLGASGSTQLCHNSFQQISTCSSSLRYKTNILSFTSGLSVVRQLRPITFDWKDGGMADVGFGAEEVAEIEPLLTFTNDKGEIEGVKYAQITTVLVNAVKEQQTQIDEQTKVNQSLQTQVSQQNELIRRQQTELDALKILVCSNNRAATLCNPKK